MNKRALLLAVVRNVMTKRAYENIPPYAEDMMRASGMSLGLIEANDTTYKDPNSRDALLAAIRAQVYANAPRPDNLGPLKNQPAIVRDAVVRTAVNNQLFGTTDIASPRVIGTGKAPDAIRLSSGEVPTYYPSGKRDTLVSAVNPGKQTGMPAPRKQELKPKLTPPQQGSYNYILAGLLMALLAGGSTRMLSNQYSTRKKPSKVLALPTINNVLHNRRYYRVYNLQDNPFALYGYTGSNATQRLG